MNQVDLFQSMSPFNPQKGQIPKDTVYPASPTYDMTLGTHIIYYKDPNVPAAVAPTNEWPVYREPARWNYADAAARTGATGFVASDIGQLAYQKGFPDVLSAANDGANVDSRRHPRTYR